MSDVLFLLLTLALFGLLALLVGVIDRRLDEPDQSADRAGGQR